MASQFENSSQRGDEWFSVGLASSFPNIKGSTGVTLSEQQLCGNDNTLKEGCRVFLAPDLAGDSKEATQMSSNPKDQVNVSLRRGEQVLVFQYQGKFHAIDNVRAIPDTLNLMQKY